MKARIFQFLLAICLAAIFAPARAFGWAYQGHILITRLAAIRLIDDPATPAGLRDFLKNNVDDSMADCQALAETAHVGMQDGDLAKFTGLEQWSIMPDRIRFMPQGKVPIAPYGATESMMHFLDLEYFARVPIYRDDLSNKPRIEDIPEDLSDPRFKRAGFLSFRIGEMYTKLGDSFAAPPSADDPDAALPAAGFLAHYIEDSTQPHHSTVDFGSLSYLAGHIPQIPSSATQPGSATLLELHLPATINPHGNIEFSLFDNSDPPLADYRKEYWKDLTADIAVLAGDLNYSRITGKDMFYWDLSILSDSYDYLPFVGHAAQAAYATGTFDPKAFFTYEGMAGGKKMTMVQFIALQNAKAVLHVETAWRAAWERGHPIAATKPAA